MKFLQKMGQSSGRVAPVLILAGILMLGTAMGLAEGAIALPFSPSHSTTSMSAFLAQSVPPPETMVITLRQSLSKQTGIPAKKLRVVESSQRTWPDGCLGLAKADEMCTQMMVSGWRIVFTNGIQRWTFRTDSTGRNYRLETPTSRSQRPDSLSSVPLPLLQPVSLSDTELPPKLKGDEIVRVIARGGFVGQTRQTTLLKDGRMLQMRLNPDGTSTPLRVHRVSSAQVNHWQKTVQQHLPQFDRCNYLNTPSSADFITVPLTSTAGTIRYADSVQNQLPQELQTVLQTWNQMGQ